jgi:hypothetical protein
MLEGHRCQRRRHGQNYSIRFTAALFGDTAKPTRSLVFRQPVQPFDGGGISDVTSSLEELTIFWN